LGIWTSGKDRFFYKDLTFKREKYSLFIDFHHDNKIGQQEEPVAYIAKELC